MYLFGCLAVAMTVKHQDHKRRETVDACFVQPNYPSKSFVYRVQDTGTELHASSFLKSPV